MKSSTASSTGTGFLPDSGADPGSYGGSSDTAAGTFGGTSGGTFGATSGGPSGGYGLGGPLGTDAVWMAPVDDRESPADPTNTFADPDPDPRVRPGGGSAGLTGRVALTAVVGLDSGQTLEVLKDLGRLRSWVDAQEAKAVTHLHDLTTEAHAWVGDPGRVRTLAAAEIAAATLVPEVTAGALVDHSDLLTRDLPTTLAAMEEGKLSKRHAWAVVGEAISIPDTAPGVIAAFECHLIGLAAKTTVVKFCRQAQRLREMLHPESITIRHRKAVQDRRVYLDPAQDGMAWLQAFLPVQDAAGIFHRVDTAARNLQGTDEPRTLTQLRADVLMDVLTSAGPESASGSDGDAGTCAENNPGNGPSVRNGEPGQSRESRVYWGVQAKVFVTVPVMTLLGGDKPGELEGYGPISPDTARSLAGHAPSFTRILTHPYTGTRLGADATTYRVPKDLQDAVRVRDGTCRHPGCNRLAVFCELDHTTPWSQGGKTSYGNLACLCKRHHMLKTEGYWHYTQPEPGTIIAISPAGETYRTTPNPPPSKPETPPPF
ncbi:HNH endonuclease signature motif containing protein [Arthrobacter sp. H20]|uniref:HNH endonuclease signature motif containing protein n=1 Tax=Arthrobacter sp. H20 TaxID=1267981 RepID=UPI0004B31E85|nr:HNH endonuclease signature motif containing protein [Arthrobacter sp. H20]